MRWYGLAAGLAGCYAPASSGTPCTVRCDQSTSCPADLVCGNDQLCRSSDAPDCAVDASIDAVEVPVIGADLIAWSPSRVDVARSTGTRFKAPETWFSSQFTFLGDQAN